MTSPENRSSSNESPSPLAPGVRVVRLGHGANCSSVGSAVDLLFASAVVGGAVLAAVLASLRPVGAPPARPSPEAQEPEPREPP